MINKKNVLGKHPFDLGVKDAIHTAIVSVRAGAAVRPGQRCGLNEFNEAVPKADGPGVADPFLNSGISCGQFFWMLLEQDAVPNVRHEWEHPTVNFAPPTREAQQNKWIARSAAELGVTYQQLMDACAHVIEHGEPMGYPGTLTAEELETALDKADSHDIWSEWSNETGYEFENEGTSCCPEYSYPDESFFSVPAPIAEAEAVPEPAE